MIIAPSDHTYIFSEKQRTTAVMCNNTNNNKVDLAHKCLSGNALYLTLHPSPVSERTECVAGIARDVSLFESRFNC